MLVWTCVAFSLPLSCYKYFLIHYLDRASNTVLFYNKQTNKAFAMEFEISIHTRIKKGFVLLLL